MSRLFIAAGTAALLALAGCTAPAGLLLAALPDNTVPILLSHLESVDDTNRQRLVDFEQRGDWKGLAQFAEENISRDRMSADWWMVAGYAYARLGETARAIACYREVVHLSPEDPTGWNLLAQAYRTAGQAERAVETLDQALLVRQDSPTAYYLLGESYSDLARLELAVRAYQQALKLDEKFALAWFGMGRAYVRLARDADAANVVKVLQPLDPRLSADLAAMLQPSR